MSTRPTHSALRASQRFVYRELTEGVIIVIVIVRVIVIVSVIVIFIVIVIVVVIDDFC